MVNFVGKFTKVFLQFVVSDDFCSAVVLFNIIVYNTTVLLTFVVFF